MEEFLEQRAAQGQKTAEIECSTLCPAAVGDFARSGSSMQYQQQVLSLEAATQQYIHTYIHPCMPACINTYIPMYVYVSVYIHMYARMCIYIHMYLSVYLQTIHTYMPG